MLITCLDFVTTLLVVVFFCFIASMMNESNKLAVIISDDTRGLLKDEANCSRVGVMRGLFACLEQKQGFGFVHALLTLFHDSNDSCQIRFY